MTASNPTLADKVRGLKIDHSVHCMNVRANAAFVEVFGGACACDAADHNARVESIAAEAERAPVMGEVRALAEEALGLDAEATAGPWLTRVPSIGDPWTVRVTQTSNDVTLVLRAFATVADLAFIARARTLLPALARALLAAPVAPKADEPDDPASDLFGSFSASCQTCLSTNDTLKDARSDAVAHLISNGWTHRRGVGWTCPDLDCLPLGREPDERAHRARVTPPSQGVEDGRAGLPAIEIKRAEREAATECRHCWHSTSDAAADNHDATCCQCRARSAPTRRDEDAVR